MDSEMQVLVISFFDSKQAFEKQKKEFEKQKKQFYDCMDGNVKEKDYFSFTIRENPRFVLPSLDINSAEFTPVTYKVSRVTPNKIVWDTEAIIDRFGLDTSIELGIIRRKYEVDATAIEALAERGRIKPQQLEGCYTVEHGSRYWKVTKRNG